ncbi:MAG TPA: flagellar export chaperone FliS [Atribacteraceae bacterium]|nr:flagellar export chaperone FliS [Atribacteraceae bacterium]
MNAYNGLMTRSYQRNAVDTGSPLRLIIMLYDGAIRFFRLAEKARQDGNAEQVREHIFKAEKIIFELMASLNIEEGGEIAAGLFRLYQFMVDQCSHVHEENGAEALANILKILVGLRASWVELEKAPQVFEPQPVNVSG